MLPLVMCVTFSFGFARSNTKPLLAAVGAYSYSMHSRSQYFSESRGKRSTVLSRDDPAIMKLDTPQFRSIFTPELTKLSHIFKDNGYELRIAGGAVRDLLLGKLPTDLDFATTATPTEMKEMFQKEQVRILDTTGEKHGTITPRVNDKANFEITTLRYDAKTDGRHAEVIFTTDWKIDANRRDLTINSMFLDLDGTVYDYFFGYEDLMNKRVVFVGDPNARIREDYLRILRYFRFYGRICENPDAHDLLTLEAIRTNAEGLGRISGERIWSELSKILAGNFAGDLVLKMVDLGLGPYMSFPQNSNVDQFSAVWERAKNLELKPMSLLAGLFNNADDVRNFNARVKLSALDRDLGLFIVQNRDKDITTAENPMRECQTLYFRNNKMTYARLYVSELLKYHGREDLYHEFQNYNLPKFPLSGKILLKFGIPPSKLIGKILGKLQEDWIDSNFVLSEEELIERIPSALEEVNSNNKKFKSMS